MADIREVAKIAGVSPATVSRVINGTAKVRKEKRDRVLEAIRKTGYKPNEVARILFTGQSHLLGMIVPDIENPFFSEMAKAIEEKAYSCGYQLTLCSSGNDKKKEIDNIDMLSRLSADGILLLTSDASILESIPPTDIPIIVLDRIPKHKNEIACLRSDHYQGGRLAAELFIKNGAKRIVYATGPQALSSARERYDGFSDRMREERVRFRIIDSGYSYEEGVKAGNTILKDYPDTDAIFCANDINAIGVMKTLLNQGVRIPEDMQIIGFDDIAISSMVSPELTTIHQDVTLIGSQAVELLFDYFNGKPIRKSTLFPVRLIERESTRR